MCKKLCLSVLVFSFSVAGFTQGTTLEIIPEKPSIQESLNKLESILDQLDLNLIQSEQDLLAWQQALQQALESLKDSSAKLELSVTESNKVASLLKLAEKQLRLCEGRLFFFQLTTAGLTFISIFLGACLIF